MIKVAVIGATGRLAPMVIKEMLENGFTVKALVRNKEKAKKLLPTEVEIIKADLEDVQSLISGLKNIDHVYLNLSTEHPDSKFQPEFDGVRNIIMACEQNSIKGTSNNSVFKNQFGDKFIWSRYFIQKKLSRCFFDVFRPHCGLNIIKWTHLSREGF
jgi:nucleoside-diphosphate-sugar epimerase